MISAYFACQNFQHLKIHVLQFIFHSGICPFLGFWWHMCKSWTSRCLSFSLCIALCVVLTLLRQFEVRLVLQLRVFTIFLKAVLKLFSLRTNWDWKNKQTKTDRESAKAVKIKSAPGIVESSVSKSSAYYQYCYSLLFSRPWQQNWH